MTNNLDDLFAPKVKIEDDKPKKLGEYNVSADKGKNGVYRSIIRFIPWWKDPSNSVKGKFTCWLVDPLTNKGRYVDDPASVNQPSILNDTYWKLKNSNNAALVQQADRFSRKQTFASLIQVIKDDNQPELNGKILIWRFGKKIQDKLNLEKNPPIGESRNPWDIINGRYFALQVTKVSGFNNYDNCQFIDFKNPGLQLYNDNNTLVEIVNENSDKQKVFEYLQANSPDLDEYSFKPWTKDITDYVYHVVSLVLNQNVSPVSNTIASVVNAPTDPASIPTVQGVNTVAQTDMNLSSVTFNTPESNNPVYTVDSLESLNKSTNDQLKNLNIGNIEIPNINEATPTQSTGVSDPGLGNLDDIFGQI